MIQYDEVVSLRAHPAWTLLRSPHSALVLSFCSRVFVERNAAGLPASELVAELDDQLYALNEQLGDESFPKPAAAYLDDWASADHGWLRKYYAPDSDEARYDLAPAVERALLWAQDLRPREFVGTESRLSTIFELLRQMVYGADDDPEHRLVELRRRRAELDAEIARAERGDVTVLNAVSQRDRYQLFARTARELLSDFREVEENFRRLDRDLRARIVGWTGSKGALLDETVVGRNSIAESDQGRSFQAFYDFLLSHERQAELTGLLERLADIEHLADIDERMARVHFAWIDASERTQATVRQLSEQLRRFLDDQTWVEQRRVFDLLRAIEAKALALRDLTGPVVATTIEDTGVEIALPTERPLYRRASAATIETSAMPPGEEDFDSSALLSQTHVDSEELVRTVLSALGAHEQVRLGEVVSSRPLEQGLAELIGYLSLSEPGLDVVFDEDQREQIAWEAPVGGGRGGGDVGGGARTGSAAVVDGPEGVCWVDGGSGTPAGERTRVAELPRVTFRRGGASRDTPSLDGTKQVGP